MVDLTPEQYKEANDKVYDLAVLLGVDIHDTKTRYTKAEVQEVRDALDVAIKTDAQAFLDKGLADGSIASKVQTRRGLRDNNIKASAVLDDMLKGKYSDNPEMLARIDGGALQGAFDAMQLLDAVSDGAAHQSNSDFHNIAKLLRVDLPAPNTDPDKVSYTQEQIQEVGGAYNRYLNQSQAMIDTADGIDPSVTAEDVLIHNLIASIDNPTEENANDIYRIVMQAPANMNYLTMKAGGQVATPVNAQTSAPRVQAVDDAHSLSNILGINSQDANSRNTPQEYKTVTRMAAIDANGNEVAADPRIANLEQALAQIVPRLNELPSGGFIFDKKPYGDTPPVGNIDGFLDKDTLASYQGAIKHLNHLSSWGKGEAGDGFIESNTTHIVELLQGNVNESMLAKVKEYKNAADPAVKAQLDAEIRDLNTLMETTIPNVFKDIASLEAEGLLSSPVTMREISVKVPIEVAVSTSDKTITPAVDAIATAPKDSKPSEPPVTKKSIDDIISGAEVKGIEGHIKDVEGMLFKLGAKIDEFDKFGLSESIVTPLTKADLEDDGFGVNSQDMLAKAVVLIRTIGGAKNPNGLYSVGDGEALKRAILTKDALQPIRDTLGISKMDDATANKYFNPPVGVSDEKLKEHEDYKTRVDDQLKLSLLNGMFVSLDAIADAKLIDEEKARSTTKMNIMLDGMAMAMDKWLPGMSGMLEKFFDSDFGQMIGGILSMFGINVNRLWGDKNDLGVEAARPIVEKGFDIFIKTAKNDLGTDDFAAVMAKAKIDMLSKLQNPDASIYEKGQKFVFDKVMDKIFDGKSEEFIEKAITDAMDAAIAAGDYDAARTAFSDSLIQAGADYQNNSDLTLDQMSASLTSTVALAKSPAMQEEIKSQIEAGNIKPTTPSLAAAGSMTGREIDASFIAAGGNSHVALVFTPDTTEYDQDPMRFSNGRVGNIVAGLSELDLSVITNEMVQKDGEFLDKATVNVSAMIEEALIRAQVHDFKDKNPDKEITQSDLDGFKDKLTTENLPTLMPILLSYMEAEGASSEAVDAVSNNLISLAHDYSNPDSSLSVLDQSFLGGQLSKSLETFAPQAAVAILPPKVESEAQADPLRDKYLSHTHKGKTNLDKLPCDVPMFYTKEGSDSVFAIIRERSNGLGDKDPYDDTYRVLELTDYLTNRTIDPASLKALQDNYKWVDSSAAGIGKFIDHALCLESLTQEVEQKQTLSSSFNKGAGCGLNPPETFKDLCRLTQGQAAALLERGLDIEALFEEHIQMKENGTSGFAILEPSAHGIKGGTYPDLIVAMRDGDNIDYRVINYNSIDNIKPLSEQRAAGISDMSQIHNPVGARRLDDFLDDISVSSGGVIRHSANVGNGYVGIDFIIPNGNGGTSLQNGLRYVYADARDEAGAMEKYSNGYYSRSHARTAYEQVQRDLKYSGGVPHPNVRGVIVNAGQRPLNEPAVKEEEKPSWIARLFNKSGDEEPDINSQIKQNAGDMNADAANEDDFNPHNADLLNLARPQSSAVGASAR